MYSIHYYEGNTYILNIASRIIPSVNENVRIKGRNGKDDQGSGDGGKQTFRIC